MSETYRVTTYASGDVHHEGAPSVVEAEFVSLLALAAYYSEFERKDLIVAKVELLAQPAQLKEWVIEWRPLDHEGKAFGLERQFACVARSEEDARKTFGKYHTSQFVIINCSATEAN